MAKQIVVYLCNGIPFRSKKEYTMDTSNINESENKCAEYKKANKNNSYYMIAAV